MTGNAWFKFTAALNWHSSGGFPWELYLLTVLRLNLLLGERTR